MPGRNVARFVRAFCFWGRDEAEAEGQGRVRQGQEAGLLMPGGRPRKIESPEEMEARVDAFFAQCEANNRPPTVTGMALALGLSCRESLDEYGRRPEFSDTVKAAKSRVAAAYEARLWEGQPAGAIFALKNMGWSDRQEHAVSGSLNIGITPTENDL